MVSAGYFELRKSGRSENSISADVMRHLHTRQHLGRAVVITDDPIPVLSAARKQWLKLSRSLQKQRSSTLNADKILKYTHAVTRMQRMHFTAKTPLERPEADIYFLSPDNITTLPIDCWTVYFLSCTQTQKILPTLRQLPEGSLIVDYCSPINWENLGFRSKKDLEAKVRHQWNETVRFLKIHHIDIAKLVIQDVHDVDAIDDALDTLLGGHAHEFMIKANEFQRALELARPLRLTKTTRTAYDSLILLAHRVQALTPGAFNKHFLEVYNEDDTFFFYDIGRRFLTNGSESLLEAFARQTAAGRHHLANSLQTQAKRSV